MPRGPVVVVVVVELLDWVAEWLLACPRANPLMANESTRIQSFFIRLSLWVLLVRMRSPLTRELLARSPHFVLYFHTSAQLCTGCKLVTRCSAQ